MTMNKPIVTKQTMNFQHASMPPFADFADDHNDNMPSISNIIDFNDEEVLEEEFDENEFYVDYLAGLQLNQNGSKSLLYKYTGYEEIEPGESENGEYDAAEFVSLLYLYLRTSTSRAHEEGCNNIPSVQRAYDVRFYCTANRWTEYRRV